MTGVKLEDGIVGSISQTVASGFRVKPSEQMDDRATYIIVKLRKI